MIRKCHKYTLQTYSQHREEGTQNTNHRETPAQFENRIKPRVCARRIAQGILRTVLRIKTLHFVSRNWRKENSVACGLSRIKLHFF